MAVRARERLSVRLDWISVPYRRVYAVGGLLAFLLAAVVAGVAFRQVLADLLSRSRKEAAAEIDEAKRLLGEASPLAREERSVSLRENASGKLSESQRYYERRDYLDARTAAIVSQNYSLKILDLVRGDAASSRDVRFYRIEGEVRVKRAGQFHWEEATPRSPLSIGDQIKTGARSAAQIIYFDGTITTMRHESLLEIKELYEEPHTRERRVKEKLNWGEVAASTRKANVAGSFHEIQSASLVAKSNVDAEFTVSYDQARDQGRVSLVTGRLDVATDRDRVTIRTGESVGVDRGVMGAVEKLPPSPRLLVPADHKIFVLASPKNGSTTLAWERVPEASRYRLQLSERSLFGDLLVDKLDVKVNTVELPGLPPSAYYWRVAALDTRGRSSPFSPARKFRITTAEMRDKNDTKPPPLAVQDFIQNGPYVILNGKTEPGAMIWVDGEKVDVDEGGTFYAVVRLKAEGRNHVRVTAQDSSGNESRKTLEAYLDAF